MAVAERGGRALAAGHSWPGVSFRGPIIQAAGFTSDPPEKFGNPPPDLTISDDTFKMTAKNHLLLLGEFYATFLLSWSPVLWCFPQGGSLPCTPPSPWDEEAEAVAQFGAGLKAVRRALANIATYMICDDHEVTDDWYLNRLWCNRVLGQDADTLGRRVIRNALIAYAIFEAWGNEPDRYDAASPNGTSGASLLS